MKTKMPDAMTCARASLSPSLRPDLSEFVLIVEREREMLENPTPTLHAADTSIKRYAPPNQRNRHLNRRKSADRFERTNNLYGNDLEKNQVAVSRNFSTIDHGESGSGNLPNETPRSGLIALEGCCNSEASQLLNERWTAVLHYYNNPSTDLSERPVMYSGSAASAWGGQFRLPHQIMAPPSGSQMDFLVELRRAMCNKNANFGI